MGPNDYQNNAVRTLNKNLADEPDLTEGLVFAGMELSAEVGEFNNLVYKWTWQEHDLDKRAMALELGDVLWGIAIAAHYLGYTLEDIQDLNVAKRQVRYPKGHFDREDSIARVDVGQVQPGVPDMQGNAYSEEVAEQLNKAIAAHLQENPQTVAEQMRKIIAAGSVGNALCNDDAAE